MNHNWHFWKITKWQSQSDSFYPINYVQIKWLPFSTKGCFEKLTFYRPVTGWGRTSKISEQVTTKLHLQYFDHCSLLHVSNCKRETGSFTTEHFTLIKGNTSTANPGFNSEGACTFKLFLIILENLFWSWHKLEKTVTAGTNQYMTARAVSTESLPRWSMKRSCFISAGFLWCN